MVKDAIRKMKFNKQIRKAEGEKLLKVELVISVNGIKVEESRHKVRAAARAFVRAGLGIFGVPIVLIECSS